MLKLAHQCHMGQNVLDAVNEEGSRQNATPTLQSDSTEIQLLYLSQPKAKGMGCPYSGGGLMKPLATEIP